MVKRISKLLCDCSATAVAHLHQTTKAWHSGDDSSVWEGAKHQNSENLPAAVTSSLVASVSALGQARFLGQAETGRTGTDADQAALATHAGEAVFPRRLHEATALGRGLTFDENAARRTALLGEPRSVAAGSRLWPGNAEAVERLIAPASGVGHRTGFR